MEIIDYQENLVLKEKCNQFPNTLQCKQFWMKYVCPNKYPELKNLATKPCIMFGSTYVCEASFSKMNFIKKKFRSRLTDDYLNDLIKIYFTNLALNIKKLVNTNQCNFSH